MGFLKVISHVFAEIARIREEAGGGAYAKESDVRNWKTHRFEETFVERTPAKLKVQYRLQGIINRVNDTEFRYGRMLEPKSIALLLNSAYYPQIFQCLQHTGFAKLGWAFHLGKPVGTKINRFCFEKKDDELFFHLDENCREILVGLKRKACAAFGCTVETIDLKVGIWDERIIEENFEMIPSAELEKIKGDENYSAYEEWILAAAMKRRLEIEKTLQQNQTDQIHERPAYRIETRRGVGNGVEISWKFKENYRSGWTLCCFWKQGDSLGHDPFSEIDNGSLLIDDYQDDKIIKNLEAGWVYSFTAFVKERQDASGTGPMKDHYVRFQLRIPSEEETKNVERLFNLAEGRHAPAEPKVDPLKEELQKKLKGLRTKLEMQTGIQDFKETARENVKKQDYSSTRRKEELQAIDRLCEESLMECLKKRTVG